MIQVISFFACAIVAIIIVYYICKQCQYTCSIVKYCFPFFSVSCLLRNTCRTDLFVEVTNLTKGNTVWAHFTATGCYPTSLRISRQIPKERVRMETCCLCFKMMHVDWDDIKVTGILGIEVEMPRMAKVSIFKDNDLTNVNDDHFEINLMACLLNQIYIVPSPPPTRIPHKLDHPVNKTMVSSLGKQPTNKPMLLQHSISCLLSMLTHSPDKTMLCTVM